MALNGRFMETSKTWTFEVQPAGTSNDPTSFAHMLPNTESTSERRKNPTSRMIGETQVLLVFVPYI